MPSSVRDAISKVLRRLTGVPSRVAERRHALVGPADLWEAKRRFQISFLKTVGLRPAHHLLDIGCGTLRGGIPIIAYLEPGHYYGIESRRPVLDEGRRELQESGLAHKRPTLIAADELPGYRLENLFDYVWAFSVLIHMRDDALGDTLRLARSCLKETGSLYANVNIGDQADGQWQGFPVVWRSVAFYAEACARHGLELEDIGPSRAFGNVSHSTSPDTQRMLKIRPI